MDTTNSIKKYASLSLALIMSYLVATLALEPQLPDLLQEYLKQEFEREYTTFEEILFLVMIPVAIVNIWALIGLIRVKVWAKKLYIQTTILMYVAIPFLGPYIDHAVAYSIGAIDVLVTGILLTLLLYTNSAFNKALKKDSASGAL